MAQDQVEEVKKKTDIVELIGEYVKLSRSGRNFKALCPFHSEKTPSFMVSPELGIFKCFGCGRGGDVITFLQEYEKVDFPQALKLLADRAGIKLRPLAGWTGFAEKEEIYKINYIVSEFYHYLLTSHDIGKGPLSYLRKRGISDESIEVFKLGFAPDKADATFKFLTEKRGYKPELCEKAGLAVRREGKIFDRFRGRIIFPLHDHLGKVAGFSGRVLGDKEGLAKYINTPDTVVYRKGRLLYGLHITKPDIKDNSFAVVVEGELDVISSWQTGLRSVVAIKGSALTEDQAILLSRYTQEFRIATDSDYAGSQAARRGIEVAQNAGVSVKIITLGKYKDPDEAAQQDASFWKEAVNKAAEFYDFLIDEAFQRFDAQTSEGKARISRYLSPIIASIEDEIVKAHCIKKVAEGLGVPSEAVFSQVGKQRIEKGSEREKKEEKTTRTRRELLEEYLLSLALQVSPQRLKDPEIAGLLRSPACLRLVSEFSKFYSKKKAFDPSEFADGLPGELVELFARLILKEVDDPELELPEVFERRFAEAKREIEKFNLKEDIAGLTVQIKGFEESGKTGEIKKLEKKISEAGLRLASLEAA